ncbi:unnamed protein product [Anisakis simplex]|uniref:RING-type E3 ubiquitin transferase BRCA1 n=1 Tax=Anisakis simplex TaxID=6269 RepID=A0A0M3K0R5_ANISI|nr:unnamed protein product [Anisakis simplex]
MTNSEMDISLKMAGPIKMLMDDLMNMKLILRCGICCSTLRDPVVTTCCHAFCKECLHQCIDKLKTLKCPVCNQRLNRRNCGDCPQLNDILDRYLKFARAYKRDCLGIRLPKEAEFIESQLVNTQNTVTSTVARLPLRSTTNTVISNSKEQPSSSKQPSVYFPLKRSFDDVRVSNGSQRTESEPPEQKQRRLCESSQLNGNIPRTAPIVILRKTLKSAFRSSLSKPTNLSTILESSTDSSATPSDVQTHANESMQQAQQISDRSSQISESLNEPSKQLSRADCAAVSLSPQESSLSKTCTTTTEALTDQRANNVVVVVVSGKSLDQNLPESDANNNANTTEGVPIAPPSSSLECGWSDAADRDVDMVTGSDAISTTLKNLESDVAIGTVENQYGKMDGIETSDKNIQQQINSLQISQDFHNATDDHISKQEQLRKEHSSQQLKAVPTEGCRSNNDPNIMRSDALHGTDRSNDNVEESRNANKQNRDVCLQVLLPTARRNVKIQVKRRCKDHFTQTDSGSFMADAVPVVDLDHAYVLHKAAAPNHVSSQTPSIRQVNVGTQVEQSAVDVRVSEVSTQTEGGGECERKSMDIQTDFCGIDRIRIVDKGDKADSETGSTKRLSVDCYVQTTATTTAPNLDRFKSDASEAVSKLELMVTLAETRVQALLACLPWIPTFLGMSYDNFCERFDCDDLTEIDHQRLENNAERIDTNDDECRSVVDESEVATHKYVRVGDVDQTEPMATHSQQTENNPVDDETNCGDHRERLEQSKVENCTQRSATKHSQSQVYSSSESMTIDNSGTLANNSLLWSSQQPSVSIASKINTFISNCKEVVTNSLQTCPMASSSSCVAIKFMVSGLKQTSEAEQVKSFLKMFPTSCLSHEMTRDCTHLVIYNTEDRLCKSRSLKYAYAIANRCIIVTHQWIVDSVQQKELQSIDGYEVEGDLQVNRCSRAARRSRQGDADLFNGFTFYLPVPYFRFSKIVTKDRLQEIIEMMSGKCVDHLWDLPSSSKRAFIIFAPGSSSVSAARKFELDKGVEVLRADWILDSVCEYRVLLDNTQIYRVALPIGQ